jgi:hypothetical protein
VTAEESGRRALGDGAAQGAPTAPHATPHGRGRRRSTGPERFWGHRRTRIAATVALLASVAAHGGPWVVSAIPAGIDVHDLDGDAVLPFDILVENAPAPPAPEEPAAPPPEPPAPAEGPAVARADAGPVPKLPKPDAGAATDAAADGGAPTDGAVAEATDAAPPLEPEAVASAVQGGPAAIEIAIDAEVIRKHPVGAKMGYLLRGIPQWEDFMHGTPIDPVKDVDWILISGNSLIHTENDSVVLHYSASDAKVDQAVRIVTRRYGRGGAIDAGVPGVRANVTYADRAERVLLQPGSHVLAIVPPRTAPAIARQLAGRHISPPLHPGEALFWRFVGPHRLIGELPETILEMRLRVVPRADGSADVYAEGDTKDADDAQSAAKDVARFVRRHDDPITSLVTRGILDHVDVTSEGKLVKAHLTASLEQIANLVSLVGGIIGVDDPETAPSATPPGAAPGLR